MPTEETASGPGVKFPPPFLFVGGLLLAWLLDRKMIALPFSTSEGAQAFLRALSYTLVIGGLAIAAAGMITFARARTSILPNRPASRLVESGPYRFSRNPMYTGLTVAYLGGSLILKSIWGLLILPIVLLLLYRFVVQREERYLVSQFGSAYEEYRRRVKRWL